MDTKAVVNELKEKFPGKNIIVDEKDGYLEIICEIEPTGKHPKRSVALAVVGKGREHKHKKTKESYTVIKGKLNVYISGKKNTLKKGEKIDIPLNTPHYPEGSNTWFYAYSTPGWTKKDHILV